MKLSHAPAHLLLALVMIVTGLLSPSDGVDASLTISPTILLTRTLVIVAAIATLYLLATRVSRWLRDYYLRQEGLTQKRKNIRATGQVEFLN